MGEQFRLVVTHMETACTFYAYREVNTFTFITITKRPQNTRLSFAHNYRCELGFLIMTFYEMEFVTGGEESA